MAIEVQDLVDKLPTVRLTREQLMKRHRSHLKKQDTSDEGPRPVKQPIMSEAYPASSRSIRDLEIVSRSYQLIRTRVRIVDKDRCR